MPPSFQSGITNRPPEHNLLAALAFTGSATADTSAAREVIVRLRELVRRELRSDLDDLTPQSDKSLPPVETGELGFQDGYDRAHLTVTLGISSSGFDRLGVAGADRPQDLIPIPWALLQDNPVNPAEGDLILQVCSDDLYVCEHLLRRVEEEIGDGLIAVWTMLGAQRYTTRQGRTSREEGRALIGFIDGTSNLSPRHQPEDAVLTFVDPAAVASYPTVPQTSNDPYTATASFPTDLRPPPAAEPEWTRDGTYMVVRASTQNIGPWDDLPLGVQEGIVGRWKHSGASLDLADDPALTESDPAFATDHNNTTVSVTSHARKTNPRRPGDEQRRIFRRGYPLIQPTSSGTLQRGLLFICFARTISTQFEFIWRAWVKNPNFPTPIAGADRLLEFDTTVLVGGYYFVPPITNRNQPWNWVLPY